ncbi:MAG: 50S ribosomal protein L4 [Acidobacteria bacterium]|nr:50S ribosomal protein L4 [Acidobacteriota bacterium]MYC80688.1 50S ribosomal protein L4 [Acidobacteriota bacterium]
MATLDVVNLENEVVDQLDLHDTVFAAKVNKSLLYLAVKHYRDSLRQGTHSTKTRAEVRGGGRKPWRQKGTGRARVGSSRNPLWRKGGVAHGPKPRSYAFRLPRKMLQGAMRSALSDRFASNCIRVVAEFTLPNHKTRELDQVLRKLETRRKLLIVDNGDNANLARASGNLPEVKVVSSRGVTVYDLLNSRSVVFSRKAIEKLQEGLQA